MKEAVANFISGSPQSMADAVLEEAKRTLKLSQTSSTYGEKDCRENADEHTSCKKRARLCSGVSDPLNEDHDNTQPKVETEDLDLENNEALASVFESHRGGSNCQKGKDAMENMLYHIATQVESLVEHGLQAYHEHREMIRDVSLARTKVESMDLELQRLRFAMEQNQTSTSNLTRALDKAKMEAKDAARLVKVEARLRADASHLRSERDAAAAEAEESKRRVALLESDLKSTQEKLNRLMEEKQKLVVESKAAISLAQSLQNSGATAQTTVLESYKKKVYDLTGELRSRRALADDQKSRIDEMRQLLERLNKNTMRKHNEQLNTK